MTRDIARVIAVALLGLAGAAAVAADVRPLLDSHGELEPADPAALPTRAEHRTQAGLYATEAQARQLEATLAGDVITARVGCCGAQRIGDDVRRIWGSVVAYEAPFSTPVLIRGTDLRHAARVVDGLTGQGLTRVFLVNPAPTLSAGAR